MLPAGKSAPAPGKASSRSAQPCSPAAAPGSRGPGTALSSGPASSGLGPWPCKRHTRPPVSAPVRWGERAGARGERPEGAAWGGGWAPLDCGRWKACVDHPLLQRGLGTPSLAQPWIWSWFPGPGLQWTRHTAEQAGPGDRPTFDVPPGHNWPGPQICLFFLYNFCNVSTKQTVFINNSHSKKNSLMLGL